VQPLVVVVVVAKLGELEEGEAELVEQLQLGMELAQEQVLVALVEQEQLEVSQQGKELPQVSLQVLLEALPSLAFSFHS